jgi:hypothetical protein
LNASVPLTRKLGVQTGDRLALLTAPEGFQQAALEPLPDGVTVTNSSRAAADVTVAFFVERRALERRMAALARSLPPGAGLWIAWPKRSSGVPTDLSDDGVRELGLATGLVDNKVCAIDSIWSGLRFVHRKTPRVRGAPAGPAP